MPILVFLLFSSLGIIISDNTVKQLRDAVNNMRPPVCLIAWAGDWTNHQPLSIGSSTLAISRQTLRNSATIYAGSGSFRRWCRNRYGKSEENLNEAVRSAVNGVVKVLGLQPPSEERITESLSAIELYAPKSTKMPDEKKKKGDSPHDIIALLIKTTSKTIAPFGTNVQPYTPFQ